MERQVTFVRKDVVIVLSTMVGLNILSLVALAGVVAIYMKGRGKDG